MKQACGKEAMFARSILLFLCVCEYVCACVARRIMWECAEMKGGLFCFRCREEGDRQSWQQEAKTESRVERDKRGRARGWAQTREERGAESRVARDTKKTEQGAGNRG